MEYEPFHGTHTDEPQGDFVSAPNVTRTDKDLVVKNFFNFTNNEFENKRGQKFARTAFTGATYSSTVSDYLIAVTTVSTTVTIGLPRPKLVGVGKTYIVKDEVGGATGTTITIVSQGEETIDGAANTTLTTNYQAKSFYTDGTNWFIY